MFERLDTSETSYRYKLGAALKMEEIVLEILDAGIEEAQDQQVEAMFAQHRAESEGHVRALEEVFRQMGWEIDRSPSPAIDGLQAESKANAKKADNRIVDGILLQGAVVVEHHEIGVYENLIDGARAMGRKDIIELLTRTLENEQQTLRLARDAHQKVAAGLPTGKPAGGMLDKLKSAVGR
jgi:ferritin-like metal-binding protein YciE